ncbi:RDD family protein [Lyngbya confervoides]|uniref:RDD family protein n=1 Tax=Lyngbya confervoides BDU141951 TaxID=1574623 RepID=A0ABD4T6K9_9CYAN|nr:RDD family protein [Lyngbya confervoides]MCM1984348.1 RDD family protein [Lyngbya confervoides BDU141951]
MHRDYVQQPRIHQFPLADLKRRAAATAIDFGLAWLISSLGSGLFGGAIFWAWIIFLLAWYLLRVLWVTNNQGQSPGHWALDMKVVQEKSGRLPSWEGLVRREASLGFACSLLIIALNNSASYGVLLFLLTIPIGFDLWIASTDREWGQTMHDRWGKTVIINTTRGYSLDLKIKQWLKEFQARSRS